MDDDGKQVFGSPVGAYILLVRLPGLISCSSVEKEKECIG